MEEPLLGQDAADQEGDQQHDRDRAPADAVHLMHHGGQAECPRMRDGAPEGGRQRADHRHHGPDVMADPADRAADDGERRGERIVARRRRCGAIALACLRHKAAVMLREADDRRFAPGGREPAQQALEQPGPEGVEPFHPAHIDVDAADLGVAGDHPPDQPFELARPLGRPRSGGAERQPVAIIRAFEQRPAVQSVSSHPWRSTARPRVRHPCGRKIPFTIIPILGLHAFHNP